MSTTDSIFVAFEKYLESQPDWVRIHTKSIGDIEERSPWRETVFRKGKFTIVHWENIKHISHMSGPTPRHSWRVSHKEHDWCLGFTYGTAPH